MYLQTRKNPKTSYIPKSIEKRKKIKTFVFKVSFPIGNGRRNVIYFTLKFEYAELAIRWSNEMRKLINDHYPQHIGSVVFRFLDLSEMPKKGSIVHDLEDTNPADFRIKQILELLHSVE